MKGSTTTNRVWHCWLGCAAVVQDKTQPQLMYVFEMIKIAKRGSRWMPFFSYLSLLAWPLRSGSIQSSTRRKLGGSCSLYWWVVDLLLALYTILETQKFDGNLLHGEFLNFSGARPRKVVLEHPIAGHLEVSQLRRWGGGKSFVLINGQVPRE